MKRAEQYTPYEVVQWAYGAHAQWPELFTPEYIGKVLFFGEQAAREAEPGTDEYHARFVQAIRAGLLYQLWEAADSCQSCALAENRICGPTLSDGWSRNNPLRGKDPAWKAEWPIGALSAEIMVVGVGPGQFEQVTGQPLVSHQVLAGSPCLKDCASYQHCFPAGKGTPQQPCEFESLVQVIRDSDPDAPKEQVRLRVLDTRQKRATETGWRLFSAGTMLDAALQQVGLWRESWNSRFHLRNPASKKIQPGSVYATNLVVCRPVDEDPHAHDGVKDRQATAEELSACRRFLDAQVYIVQPKVLLSLGAQAAQVLAEDRQIKILKQRGEVHSSRYGIPVVLEVHPSYYMRIGIDPSDPDKVELLAQSLEKAIELRDTPAETPDPETEGYEYAELVAKSLTQHSYEQSGWVPPRGMNGFTEEEIQPRHMESIPTFPNGAVPVGAG